MWKFAVFAILCISLSRNVEGVCNQCLNGFTCVSENEFQLCFNDQPDTSITYSCLNQDDICTRYSPICMPRTGTAVPACRGIQNCVCDDMDNGVFVCTSRTTFTMCHNGNYTTTRGTCPQNQMCDVELAKSGQLPCTNKCIDDLVDAKICDFELPVDDNAATTTTPPSTGTTVSTPTSSPTTITPTPPQNQANAVCATKNTSGRYPYPNNTSCLNYVFCYWQSGVLYGRDTACPTGRYFNSATGNCQTTKPAGCV